MNRHKLDGLPQAMMVMLANCPRKSDAANPAMTAMMVTLANRPRKSDAANPAMTATLVSYPHMLGALY